MNKCCHAKARHKSYVRSVMGSLDDPLSWRCRGKSWVDGAPGPAPLCGNDGRRQWRRRLWAMERWDPGGSNYRAQVRPAAASQCATALPGHQQSCSWPSCLSSLASSWPQCRGGSRRKKRAAPRTVKRGNLPTQLPDVSVNSITCSGRKTALATKSSPEVLVLKAIALFGIVRPRHPSVPAPCFGRVTKMATVTKNTRRDLVLLAR